MKGPRPVVARASTLRTGFVHVTKACNLTCRYCYFSASRPLRNELTTEEFSRVLVELAALRPHTVVITGGEPFLRPDLLNLLRALRDADSSPRIRRCVNTNGHLVTSDLARKLVGLVDEVRVSLDALQLRNDALRGEGNFCAALDALAEFHAVGFEPKVLVTVTMESIPDLEPLLELLISRGFTRINLNEMRPIGRGGRLHALRADRDEVRATIARVNRRFQPGAEAPVEPDVQCQCGVGQIINIFPNGDVFPCHALARSAFRLGNVREQSLAAICRGDGLLGQLASLNFSDLARQDEAVAGLTRYGTCMGDLYTATKASDVWRNNIANLHNRTRSRP